MSAHSAGKAGPASSRRYWYAATTSLGAVLLSLLAVELGIRWTMPQAYMVPRYDFSSRYGLALPKNTTLTKAMPGHWHFASTINEYGYRGPALAVTNEYTLPRIVTLGDSYTFGQGVHDGEEYAAVLGDELKDSYQVINLGIPGYGLTQQIRWFYEFGQLYDPSVVIMQFGANDVTDNLRYKVTTVDNGRFVFHDISDPFATLKLWLAKSFIQHSQLYNFLRGRLYQWYKARKIEANQTKSQRVAQADSNDIERFYNELLQALVQDLIKRDVRIIFIEVDRDLSVYRLVRECVLGLSSVGGLEYREVSGWLDDGEDYQSVEGHRWNAKAHRLIGEGLAAAISDRGSVPAQSMRSGEHPACA